MKEVLISIQPKWCELIASGQKKIEVRKTKPKIPTPFKCYIYKSFTFGKDENKNVICNDCGKVIGAFVCDKIECVCPTLFRKPELYLHIPIVKILKLLPNSCFSLEELERYVGYTDYEGDIRAYKQNPYFWHISDLKIYDKPKELSEFYRQCIDKENDCVHCAFAKYKYQNEFDDGLVDDCSLKLTRPPQNWCYVEERHL